MTEKKKTFIHLVILYTLSILYSAGSKRWANYAINCFKKSMNSDSSYITMKTK